MAAGYAFGQIYLFDRPKRRKIAFVLGLSLTLAFVILRLTNLYGNPPSGLGGVSQGDWHIQPTLDKTLILFFDVEKYPPSLEYLLMTVGPSLLLLGWLDDDRLRNNTSILLTFGRAPMFFYVLHLYLIHWLAVLVAVLFHQPVRWFFMGLSFRTLPQVTSCIGLCVRNVVCRIEHSLFSLSLVRGFETEKKAMVAELSVTACHHEPAEPRLTVFSFHRNTFV